MATKKIKPLIVLTTVAKKSDATRIAQSVLRKGLVACVNILPNAQSHYIWQGKIETEGEYLLLMKTHASAFPVLEKMLMRIHPYECPEIVGVAIDLIGKSYGDWLRKSLSV